MSKVYVRLKKYNKPKGNVCRRYLYRGGLFHQGEWRKVPPVIAEELAELIQPNSEDSPKALFDIAYSEEEAMALDHVDIPATEVAGAKNQTDFRGLGEVKAPPRKAAPKMIDPAEWEDDEPAEGDLELEGEPVVFEEEKPEEAPKPAKKKSTKKKAAKAKSKKTRSRK